MVDIHVKKKCMTLETRSQQKVKSGVYPPSSASPIVPFVPSFKTGPNGAALCSPFAAYSDVGEENKKQAISTISEDGEFVDQTTIISGSHHHKIY